MNISLFKQWIATDPNALDSLFFIWLDHLQDQRGLTSDDIEMILREKLGEQQ